MRPTVEERDALLAEAARARSSGPGRVPRLRATATRCASSRWTREWTRVGRSLAADVRFDDPTVSRRHALIVRQADGVRVLDDRSLNGVFVNGERVEWRVLRDGDEIVVGRYRLHFLEAAVAMEAAGATPPRVHQLGRLRAGRPAEREERRGSGRGIRALSARRAASARPR